MPRPTQSLIQALYFDHALGCIRRTNEKITEDYDEIDRRDPPVFINNTRTKVVVAAGKAASLECRVMNIGDRAVSVIRFLTKVISRKFEVSLFSIALLSMSDSSICVGVEKQPL